MQLIWRRCDEYMRCTEKSTHDLGHMPQYEETAILGATTDKGYDKPLRPTCRHRTHGSSFSLSTALYINLLLRGILILAAT
jgi:hypothetical protein